MKISNYNQPLHWLIHYLLGSGSDMKVPARIVKQALPAMVKTVRETCGWSRGSRGRDLSFTGSFCLSYSRLYEGSGFYNRPTLFYLVGGFTFQVEHVDSTCQIYAEDIYDWHAREDGEYFISPLGSNWFVKKLVALLARVFGDDKFILETENGDCGISNKFWASFPRAKAFKSIINYSLPWDEWEELVKHPQQPKHQVVECEYEILSEDDFLVDDEGRV